MAGVPSSPNRLRRRGSSVMGFTSVQLKNGACQNGGWYASPEVVAMRLAAHIVAVGVVAHREAPSERLHVVRLGFGFGVWLARVALRFRARDELHACHRQQLACFGGVQDVVRLHEVVRRLFRQLEQHAADAVAVGIGFEREHAPDAQVAAHLGVRQHAFQHMEGDARLAAQPADPAPARVQVRLGAGGVGKGVVAAVEVADGVAQESVAARAALLFDPAVFVGGHGLRGELPAEPLVGVWLPAGWARPATRTPSPRRTRPARRRQSARACARENRVFASHGSIPACQKTAPTRVAAGFGVGQSYTERNCGSPREAAR
jgi:hypothetical protein